MGVGARVSDRPVGGVRKCGCSRELILLTSIFRQAPKSLPPLPPPILTSSMSVSSSQFSSPSSPTHSGFFLGEEGGEDVIIPLEDRATIAQSRTGLSYEVRLV